MIHLTSHASLWTEWMAVSSCVKAAGEELLRLHSVTSSTSSAPPLLSLVFDILLLLLLLLLSRSSDCSGIDLVTSDLL